MRRELEALRFAPAMTVMLTMIGRGNGDLRHVAEVAALSLAFATHARLAPDGVRVAAMAGVLHDIGELYIDPDLINASRVLSSEEWSHVIVHPHIGRLLIQDLESCPAAVGIAVSEHHERLNGTGYPRAMIAGQSSVAGQLVASAELISGLLHKPNALQRAELAMKIVSGEHPRMVSAIISQASRTPGAQAFELASATIDDDEVIRLSQRMADAAELAAQLARGAGLAPRHLDLMLRTRERLHMVQRAFMSTGLDMHVAALAGAPLDHHEVFESELALREISWRVRDIGRDLVLQLGAARTSIPQAGQLVALLCG
ncbi:HD-GYP domain-containing protein [Massilia sp. Se16.2.3]|uniref:HD-GYP domain-containing protein n=1 Tax=Massilia sp. Se16.2.3 TaxID=2709303 RepID=UPI0015FF96B6|nr:HD domain-containing phosphohydrolase [Massilia sp. Se16.2.3]QNA99172.1 HD domain-containing protein [Massilia sp. Se16.2.3]